MAKTRKIPEIADPFVVVVNGVTYQYKAGDTESVPDAVADVIDNINRLMPQLEPEAGSAGQVWTRQEAGGGAWDDLPEFPVAENAADSTATDVDTLKEDFNALLAKLIAAGLMAEPEPEPEPDESEE